MVLEINSSSKCWHCGLPVKCECDKQVQSNSLFKHRKSKAHILEMQKPENKDKKPDLKIFWREAYEDLNKKIVINKIKNKV